MGLSGYLQSRRQEAIWRTLLLIIIIAAVWVVFQKALLRSCATKMARGDQALQAESWQDADYHYREARRYYAFYLDILNYVPEPLSLVSLTEARKYHEDADSGVKKILAHYQEIEQKNKEIAQQKEKIKQDFLERVKKGEISAEGEEITPAPPEPRVTIVKQKTASPKEPTVPTIPPAAETRSLMEEVQQGSWGGETKAFNEPEKETPVATPSPAPVPEKPTPPVMPAVKDEGVIEGSKPSWFNKK